MSQHNRFQIRQGAASNDMRSDPRLVLAEDSATPMDDSGLVRAATEMILAALPRRLSLAGAARILDVAPPRLEQAFARLGLNPRQHLREQRLNGLYAALFDPRTVESVDLLVLRWGFSLSSSVFAEYRRMFGEAPQQTRHRVLNGETAARPTVVRYTTRQPSRP